MTGSDETLAALEAAARRLRDAEQITKQARAELYEMVRSSPAGISHSAIARAIGTSRTWVKQLRDP